MTLTLPYSTSLDLVSLSQSTDIPTFSPPHISQLNFDRHAHKFRLTLTKGGVLV